MPLSWREETGLPLRQKTPKMPPLIPFAYQVHGGRVLAVLVEEKGASRSASPPIEIAAGTGRVLRQFHDGAEFG